MIFPIKPEDKMLQEMLSDLLSTTDITNISPGGVARSLLEIVNRKLHTAYTELDRYASMIFLSSSSGSYLDLIGAMLSCRRLPFETDNNYKYRISQQVFAAATANETAIRLKCLSVDGVKDIRITPFTRGSGSFTVHVITDELDTPDYILEKVRTVVMENKAEGIRAIVSKPRLVPIEMGVSIVPVQGVRSLSMSSVQTRIEEKVKEYLDSLGMGAPVSVQKLIALSLDLDEVSQVFLTSLKTNGEQLVVRETIEMEYDQRPYIKSITASTLS